MRHLRQRQALILFVLCLGFGVVSTATARSLPAESNTAEPGGLVLFGLDGTRLADAPRLRTDVRIEVSGVVSRARVRQRFTNPTGEWVEGLYVFPLPGNAAVDRLRMRIGDRLVVGEIQERAEAERTYARARAAGQATGLVRQQRPNVFTTAVANIPPRGAIEVEIAYQERLAWRDGAFSLRFPMVVAPRYIPGEPSPGSVGDVGAPGWSPATDQVPDAPSVTPPVVGGAPPSFRPVRLEVVLDAGLPLASIESPHHRLVTEPLGKGRVGAYRVRLADDDVPAERDFVLRWRPVPMAQPRVAAFREQWQDRAYTLLMLMPPTIGADREWPARELILVIDTSGSMFGESLAQAKAAVRQALAELRPQDRFNLIQFNRSVDRLFATARPVTPWHLARARRYIDGLEADGGTEMAPALRAALDDPGPSGLLRQVVFLTDGAVANEQALFALLKRDLGASRLFTVGIGSAPNAHFMHRAAALGRGRHTFIGRIDEAGAEMAALFRALRRPVLADLRAEWLLPGGPVEQAPVRIPDLYAGDPIVLAVASDQAPQTVRLEGRIGHRAWRQDVELPAQAEASGIHALWARRRIDDWLGARADGADAGQVREAVLRLALRHHLVSPYTSLVAVDRTPRRPADAALERHALATRLPAGWAMQKVFGRLPATATHAPLAALVGMVCLFAALGLWACERHWGRRCTG
jgi:Ca-activated chloride channel family protein